MFDDRHDAGKQLAERLKKYNDHSIILALPRGGVLVGYEVAKVLKVPLSVVVVRKLGAPHNPEFGIGAIAEEDVVILDQQTIEYLGITADEIAAVTKREKKELQRRVAVYRCGKSLPDLEGKRVILVDDGLATGVSAKAAITSIQKHSPKELIFASPVCAHDTAEILRSEVDALICVFTPLDLEAIGLYYRNFHQVSDEEVVRLLI